MAEQPAQDAPGSDHEDETTPGYKPPDQKKLEEMLALDPDDESLQKYKEALLGSLTPNMITPFPDDRKYVIVKKLGLIVDGRDDMTVDLTGDVKALKKKSFVIKEGCQYRIRVYFFVQRDIVTGLRYVQKTHRKGIQVDKTSYMVGSYAPKLELQSYTTPLEDAPSGMIARGTYTIKSQFTDDDKHDHLTWEWTLEVKKEWE